MGTVINPLFSKAWFYYVHGESMQHIPNGFYKTRISAIIGFIAFQLPNFVLYLLIEKDFSNFIILTKNDIQDQL